MKVYVMNISDNCIPGTEKLFGSLPQQLKNDAEQVKNKRRKAEILAGRRMVCRALKDMGVADEPVFKVGENGKPYAENAPYFNISHDGELAICACGKTEMGIDIVKIDRFQKAHPFKMFSEKEIELVENKVVKTALLWSLKEAYIKMTGEGLKGAAKAPEFAELLCKKQLPYGDFCQNAWFYSVEAFGYMITLCTRKPVEIGFVFC